MIVLNPLPKRKILGNAPKCHTWIGDSSLPHLCNNRKLNVCTNCQNHFCGRHIGRHKCQ